MRHCHHSGGAARPANIVTDKFTCRQLLPAVCIKDRDVWSEVVSCKHCICSKQLFESCMCCDVAFKLYKSRQLKFLACLLALVH